MQYRFKCLILSIALVMLPQCGTSFDHVTHLANPNTAIVCFGDSLTRGHGASPGMDYPAQLGALLGAQVINAGQDGDTTASALKRLDDVLGEAPRLVIVGLGGNDILQKRPKSETMADLDTIVRTIVNSGAMVVLVHAKFGLFDDPYRDGIDEIAARHGAAVAYDVLADILARPSRMSDQIHPNDAGYALMAERIHEVVGPLLEAADAAKHEEV